MLCPEPWVWFWGEKSVLALFWGKLIVKLTELPPGSVQQQFVLLPPWYFSSGVPKSCL